MRSGRILSVLGLACLLALPLLRAECGDPQLRTDDPWYPGELSCSTWPRLFKTQATMYKRATGRDTQDDQDKVLAAWFYRCTHFAHLEEGQPEIWGPGKREWNRNYWTGMFAYGFGICGTTHSQWIAEMNALLGPGRARVAGVDGHNSFEVYFTGGAYGKGDWAMVDQDQTTVIFSDDGSRLLSIAEFNKDMKKYCSQSFKPERQQGWLVGGESLGDCVDYDKFNVAEYDGGYAGPPPMVHLRAGESLRRYLHPGLADGKTFVFWGSNTRQGAPGPARNATFVNQPQRMHDLKQSLDRSALTFDQDRYANAVYTYKPNFADASYKEGVVDEDKDHVTFEFVTPYVIASTPKDTTYWGIYEKGGKSGLVLHGNFHCPVSVSIDSGKTWVDGGTGSDGMDLTDIVKGHQQYLIRFGAGAQALAGSGLTLVTVCECNVCIVPHLHDGENKITFEASGEAVCNAGPTLAQAEAHLVGGKIGTPDVTLQLQTPSQERIAGIYGSDWQISGCPPHTDIAYQIEYSADDGKSWQPVVKDWHVVRHNPEAPDWWAFSMTWGNTQVTDPITGPVQVRFRNSGRVPYRLAEAYLTYHVKKQGPVQATFCWQQGHSAPQTASHTFPATPGREDSSWSIPAGNGVNTLWVEYSCK